MKVEIPDSQDEILIPNSQPAPPPHPPTRAESLLSSFATYRAELDDHYDRRERIVKLSRDITALSKKLIFALHRINSRPPNIIFKEAEAKLEELRALFAKLEPELRGEDFWRYEKSVSPGIQEYLEGFTFLHYLHHHALPSLQVCQSSLLPSSTRASDLSPTPYVHVSIDDYLGGIADLTGELMRLAIATVGNSLRVSVALGGTGASAENEEEGQLPSIHEIGRFVRGVKGEMDPLARTSRWLPKKLVVLDQSLAKIESASYALRIRGAEYEKDPAMFELFKARLRDGGEEALVQDSGGGRREEI